MPEFPSFSKGQYGNLTAEHLNALIEQVRTNTEALDRITATRSPGVRGSAGNFPILARLESRLGGTSGNFAGDGDDGTPTLDIGYRWEEVIFETSGSSGDFDQRPNGRSYSAEKNNPALPSNQLSEFNTEDTPTNNLSGSIVLLFPYADASGRSQLIFQSPIGTQEAALLEISEEGGCGGTGPGPYKVKRLYGGNDEGLRRSTVMEDAINGCELVGNLGGSIEGADCAIQPERARLPQGVRVVGIRSGPGGMWYFNNANEYCVSCCVDGNLEEIVGNQHDATTTVTRRLYDPGYMSIYKEMMT